MTYWLQHVGKGGVKRPDVITLQYVIINIHHYLSLKFILLIFFISNLTLLSNKIHVVTPVSIEVIIIFPSRRPTRHTIEKHTNASIFMKQQKCKSAKKQFIIRVIKNIWMTWHDERDFPKSSAECTEQFLRFDNSVHHWCPSVI